MRNVLYYLYQLAGISSVIISNGVPATHSIGVNRLVTGNTIMTILKNAGIYVLRNRDSGKCYVGKDSNLGMRVRKHLSLKETGCVAICNAIKAHGKDVFDVELIPYPNISHEALNAVEKWKIRQLKSHYSQGGYNLTWGGDGWDSETARANALKRIKEGTHHFLDSEVRRASNLKRVADGTHHFLGGEVQRKRIEEGTHNFLDSEFQRKIQQKRIKEGTHHFQDSEVQRAIAQKRVEKGAHNFLGGEIQSGVQRKRVTNGTHHFLNGSFRRRNSYLKRVRAKNRRRELYRIYAALLYSKSVFEEHLYRKRVRDGFFDVEIPDTSKSAQLSIF